jgi:hypothetical protein
MISASAAARGHCSSRVEYRSISDQGGTKRMPGRSGVGETLPKACRTPTCPASMTTVLELSRMKAPMTSRVVDTSLARAPGRRPGDLPTARTIRETKMSRAPKMSLVMACFSVET